ncbi:MAG: ZIP family metal transporter [Actinobacteria bacterium]|nr:ZIP family metal transporter [Actinomycetota bacterium]
MVLLVAALAFVVTTGGGLMAVRLRDRLHLLLGFSAGAVLGVVLFEILPEVAASVQADGRRLADFTAISAGAFLVFFGLERITGLHGGREHEHRHGAHQPELGVLGAAGLSVHSFIDGVAVAVAFRSGSDQLGIAVATAVLAHDFSDGLNTVTAMLAHGNPLRRALRWLAIDASTPMAGALIAIVLRPPLSTLPYLLAAFAGSFLYIGASDLLPEAREHDSPWVAVATLVGFTVLYLISRFA